MVGPDVLRRPDHQARPSIAAPGRLHEHPLDADRVIVIAAIEQVQRSPNHQPDNLVDRCFARAPYTHHFAVAQHRDAVTEGEDLLEAMDEADRQRRETRDLDEQVRVLRGEIQAMNELAARYGSDIAEMKAAVKKILRRLPSDRPT